MAKNGNPNALAACSTACVLPLAAGPLVVLASWTFIETRVKSFHLSLLLIQTAMLGALASLDIILFYIFFEAMLVPMYFIIGVWGSEERTKAAIKFFIYTLAGSLIMLVAILAVYFLAQPAGARSFDYAAFYNSLAPGNRELAACFAGKATMPSDWQMTWNFSPRSI